MDERMKFLGAFLKQERSMAELCRSFGISRKTGYKMVSRFFNEGVPGLYDRSRAPYRQVQAIPDELVTAIMSLREAHPRWGARKLLAWLTQHRPRTRWPSASTIGRILARHGVTLPRRHARRSPPYTKPFASCAKPNAVWCADFKGWFRTGDGKRCEPLTISDAHSRYLIACQALSRTTHGAVRPIFETAFRHYGLPQCIRTDNGTPFSSTALGGLSRLAVWWIKLGIVPERIAPGHPEQNGRHERMHRTLGEETAAPPRHSLVDQQIAFNRFRREYNRERPHEALGNRTPDHLYRPSARPYPSRIPEMAYPDHMIVRKVRPAGSIWWRGGEIYISEVLVGEPIALEPIDERYYNIIFGPMTLARFDNHKRKLIRPTRKRNKK